jgi:RNA polymerase sigma factor (sigma-70 family)
MMNHERGSDHDETASARESTIVLIERLRRAPGDDAVVEELYRRARAVLLVSIRGTITRRLRSRLDAEDVLHTAFIRAMESLATFQSNDDRAFFAWIRAIARHHVYDVHRRHSVGQLRIPGDARVSRLSWLTPRGRNRSVSADVARREFIDRMLEKVKPKDAEIIRLRQLGGMSFESIASRWAMSAESVRRYYSRALSRLKEVAGRLKGGSS